MSNRKRDRLFRELETRYGIRILTFKTHHRYSLKHRALAIEWKGRKIFIFGDTQEEIPEYLGKNRIDLLFITGWQIPRLKDHPYPYDIENLVVYHLRERNSGHAEIITPYLDEHLSFLPEKPAYIILKQYGSTVIR